MKRLGAVLAAIAVILSIIPQISANETVIEKINNAASVQELRTVTEENGEALGINISSLKNMAAVYNELFELILGGTVFDGESFTESFNTAVSKYVELKTIDTSDYASVYLIDDNSELAKKVIVNQQGYTKSNGQYASSIQLNVRFSSYMTGYDVSGITDTENISDIYLTYRISNGGNGNGSGKHYIYAVAEDEFPYITEPGEYGDETENMFSNWKSYLTANAVNENTAHTFTDTKSMTSGSYKDADVTAVTLEKLLEGKSTIVYYTSQGENWDNLCFTTSEQPTLNIRYDLTKCFFAEAEKVIYEALEYADDGAINSSNCETVEALINESEMLLARVDESDEKTELESALGSLIEKYNIFNIGYRRASLLGGFSGGWYGNRELTEAADITENASDFVLNGSAYRRMNFGYNKGSGRDYYFSFVLPDTSGEVVFYIGNASVRVGSSSIELKLDEKTTQTEIERKDNTKLRVRISDGNIFAETETIGKNDQRDINQISIEDDISDFDIIGFEAKEEAEILGFVKEEYPIGYGDAERNTFDEIAILLAEGKNTEAVEAYYSVENTLNALVDCIIRDKLEAYRKEIYANIYDIIERENIRKASEAVSTAESSLLYKDYLNAAALAEVVNYAEEKAELKALLTALKERIDNLTPYVQTVTVSGNWKTGAVLTGEAVIQDDCGNGAEAIYDWIYRDGVIASGKSFTVPAAYAGRMVCLRVTPCNIAGTKGNPVCSIDIRIESTGGSGSSSGGRSGGGGNPVVRVVAEVPQEANVEEDKKEEDKVIFKDLDDKHWAKNDIIEIYNAGIIAGKGDNMFMPEENITRAEFTAMLVRVLGISADKYSAPFEDVTAADWYSKVIQAAYDNGIVSGNDGKFNPNAYITREEMAVMLVKSVQTVLPQSDSGTNPFKDDMSQWSEEYVIKAYNCGLISGTDKYTFSAFSKATRAQAAVVMKRLFNMIK